jgi:fluoride exporter
MLRFLLVFGAGGAGCVSRYAIALWIGPREFPYATLIVNVIGSFLIALILEAALRVSSISPQLSLALTTGFMGGLTTYSSFNYETMRLAEQGSLLRAGINVVATLLGCVLAGFAGLWLARRLT